MKVYDLPIKKEPMRILIKAGITTTEQLRQTSDEKLLSLRYFGQKYLEQVRACQSYSPTCTLTAKECSVLGLRMGWLNGETYTLSQIGKMLHLTPERIRQIQGKAERKLRKTVIDSEVIDYAMLNELRR